MIYLIVGLKEDQDCPARILTPYDGLFRDKVDALHKLSEIYSEVIKWYADDKNFEMNDYGDWFEITASRDTYEKWEIREMEEC